MIPLFGRSRIMDHDETLPILREGETIYVDGKPVKREPLRFEAPANVQPLTGRALQLVPEGDRYKEQYMLYAPLPRVGELPKLRTGDKVWRNGAVFVIQEAKDWGSFVEARMVRQDVQGGVPDFEPIPNGDGEVPHNPPEPPVSV